MAHQATHSVEYEKNSITVGELDSLPREELPEPWRAFAGRVDEQLLTAQKVFLPTARKLQKYVEVFEPMKRDTGVYADVPRGMTAWQKEHWRDLTLREIKQRLDAEDQRRLYAEAARRGARRRPVVVAARPRERGRGRSRVTRAGPSDDPDPPSAAAGLSHPAAVAASVRRDLLCRLIFIAEALEDGDAGMAHAVALDAIDDFRGAA
jgi:hypothetical protein